MNIAPSPKRVNENGESSSTNTPVAVGKVLVPCDQPPPYNDETVQVPESAHKVLEKEPAKLEQDTSHSSTLVHKLVPCPVRFDMASGRKMRMFPAMYKSRD